MSGLNFLAARKSPRFPCWTMSSKGTPQRRYSSAIETTNGKHESTICSPAAPVALVVEAQREVTLGGAIEGHNASGTGPRPG